MLCDREPPGRHRPGETLHPGIEPLLMQLGVLDRLATTVGARHTGIWIEWGGPRRFEAFGGDASGPWSGFQVWRADFDRLLLERACELGAVVYQPRAVTGAIIRDGTLQGVTTRSGPIMARVVVDATGGARWLARAVGIAHVDHSIKLIARYGYARGNCPVRNDAPLLVGDASGWTWTALVRPQTYQWTRVSFDHPPPTGWLPEEFRDLSPVGQARGADVTWRMADRVAGKNWFMVGDAAAMLDPTSSHGVLKAIMSGMMAAHLISAMLKGQAPGAEAAAAYQDWLAGWFNTDATRLAQFYRTLSATWVSMSASPH